MCRVLIGQHQSGVSQFRHPLLQSINPLLICSSLFLSRSCVSNHVSRSFLTSHTRRVLIGRCQSHPRRLDPFRPARKIPSSSVSFLATFHIGRGAPSLVQFSILSTSRFHWSTPHSTALSSSSTRNPLLSPFGPNFSHGNGHLCRPTCSVDPVLQHQFILPLWRLLRHWDP